MKTINGIFASIMQGMFGEPKYRGDVPAWMVGFHA
jgi:hypothetical protein